MTGARKLGWGLAALLVAGNMIGSGVYLLPAALAPIGSSSLVGWVVASAGALTLAAVFAGLGRLRPAADGLPDFVSLGLNRFFGFQASLAYWAAGWIGNVAIAVAATGYMAVFAPALRQPLAGSLCSLALIWIATVAYMLGPKLVARVGGAALLIGLAPLTAAIVAGVLAFDPETFAASWSPDGAPLIASVPASLALIFWAFLGVESAAVLSARLRRPDRDVGRAGLAGVLLAAMVYIAASVAVFGVIPAGELAVSTSPFADLAARVMGGAAGGFVAVCAVAKTIGTLSGWVMLTGETARSAARDGFLPGWFGSSIRTPVINPVIHGVLMSAAALVSAQPSLAGQFGMLVNVTTVLILIVYALCCLALIRFTPLLRWRLAGAGGLVFAVWAAAASDPDLLGPTLGFFVLTSGVWLLVRRRAASES